MGKITKLYTKDAANDPDNVLEMASGVYEVVLIIGYDKQGEFDIRASTNCSRESLNWMIDHAKEEILYLDDGE